MSRIIELTDQKPLILHKREIPGESVRICRCGLSANWPYCDDSHEATHGEAKGKLYRYVREVPEGQLVRMELTSIDPQERPSRASSPPAPKPPPEGPEVA